MRGVPRARRASSNAASGSMARPSSPALRAAMLREVFRRVVVEPRDVAEAREQRRSEQARARRRADQREGLQRELQRRRVGALALHDVDAEVLDRGVEVLFDDGLQTVDLVDEEHVAPAELREQRRELALVFDGRAGREHELRVELLGEDAGHRRLAEAGRPAEEHVVERPAARVRGRDEDAEVLLELRLADVVVEARRTQGDVVAALLVEARRAERVVGVARGHRSCPRASRSRASGGRPSRSPCSARRATARSASAGL